MGRDAFDPGKMRRGKRQEHTGDEALEELARTVIGAAITVHRTLGPGFLESVYERALSIELTHLRVDHACQSTVAVTYRGETAGEGKIDLLVDGRLVVELKTVESILPIHRAQVLSYLKAKDLPLGLLINFNSPLLKDGLERIIRTRP